MSGRRNIILNNYIYNNEAIAVISIIEVLKHMKKVSNAKFLLIFPLLSNEKLIAFLNKGTIRSLEDLIVKKGTLFSGFNNSYTELLPVSLNALVILNEMKLIKHENGDIIFTGSIDLQISFIESERLNKIQRISKKMAQILSESTEKLYLQLKVII